VVLSFGDPTSLTRSAADWIRIATEIELNYTFDAFVILHGTDTMAYTASALSFMLEDLGKTVVGFHNSTSFPLLSSEHYLDLDRSSNTHVTIAK
jgi:Asparaginase, N-terminal